MWSEQTCEEGMTKIFVLIALLALSNLIQAFWTYMLERKLNSHLGRRQ